MALGIVLAAACEADDRGDAHARDEAFQLGAQLLLRWREYHDAADPS